MVSTFESELSSVLLFGLELDSDVVRHLTGGRDSESRISAAHLRLMFASWVTISPAVGMPVFCLLEENSVVGERNRTRQQNYKGYLQKTSTAFRAEFYRFESSAHVRCIEVVDIGFSFELLMRFKVGYATGYF